MSTSLLRSNSTQEMASIDDVLRQIQFASDDNNGVDASGRFRSLSDVETIMKTIGENKAVRSLYMYDCGLVDSCLDTIANNLEHSGCIALSVGCNKLTFLGVSAIVNILKLNKLEELYLGGNIFKDEGIEELAKVLPNTTLRVLDLSECQMTSRGCIALKNAIPSSCLTELSIGMNTIGDSGVSILADALKTSSVTDLILSGCCIADDGIAALAQVLGDTSLKQLRLADNNISDRGCNILAKALKGSAMEELHLDNNPNINDDGARALLSAIIECPTLRIVDLRGNRNISDDVRAEIEEILHSRRSSILIED